MRMAVSVADKLQEAIELLRAASVETPSLDAQLLMAHALSCSRLDVIAHPERELAPGESDVFDTMLHRRARREPLAYILGSREFHGLEMSVTRDVLVPRPPSGMPFSGMSLLRTRRRKLRSSGR